MSLESALTIGDLKTRARRRVPKQFFDYSGSGSWTETTFRANETDFAEVRFRQRVATDLSERNLRTTIGGQPTARRGACCNLRVADRERRDSRCPCLREIRHSVQPLDDEHLFHRAGGRGGAEPVLVSGLHVARQAVHGAADRSRQGGENVPR